MSVMKRGMPPAGVNPVPIKVSVPAPYASPVKQLGKQPDVANFAAAQPQQQGSKSPASVLSVWQLQRLPNVTYVLSSPGWSSRLFRRYRPQVINVEHVKGLNPGGRAVQHPCSEGQQQTAVCASPWTKVTVQFTAKY